MESETMRRRVAVRWTSVSDDGDAAEAVAEIEAWLAARPETPDWDGVLGRLRDALLRAGVEPLLVGDPEARNLLFALADAEGPEALDAALDGLTQRADALIAARERARLGPPRSLDRILAESRRGDPTRDLFRL